MVNPFILLPLYIYPSPGAWNTLFNSVTANPTVHFQVIVNPASGPGTTPYPDSNYVSNVAQLNSYTNVDTLGYVHTSYGTRSQAQVKADILTYQGWSGYAGADIHMDGIFFDEAPSSASLVPYMQSVSTYAKTTMTRGNITVFNAGVNVDTGYYQYTDYVNVFENTYAAWTASGSGVNSIPTTYRAKSTIMVHDYTASTTQLNTDVTNVVNAGIAGQLFTTQTDYNVWSTQWSNYVADLAPFRTAKLKIKRVSRFFRNLVV
ncbi:hypothetical protein LTR50_005341 [Elasticomyces elasticus]|nr:hypothetical protein LTR50_005341 [Elasticomyces elasticus]